MQKNNFMKSLLALMMVLAVSMSMTSCSGLVDAVLGTEDNPVQKPETPKETESKAEITAAGATITIGSGEDMEDAITEKEAEQMVKAIEASAAKGEEYTITIKSEDPLDTKTFGFMVPSIEKADINLVFDCDIESSEKSPLVIDSESKSTTSTDAINNLTITLPNGADDVYLSLNTPETSVTVEGKATIHYMEALTATSTLYVESGVTIEEILIKGGRVIVKDGGVIETYVWPAGKYYDEKEKNKTIYVENDKDCGGTGVVPARVTYKDEEGNEQETYEIKQDGKNAAYFCKNLKVIKGENSEVRVAFYISVNVPLEKLTIGDGVTVLAGTVIAKTVEGEGTAKITMRGKAREHSWSTWDEQKQEQVWYNVLQFRLYSVEQISNVIFTEPENLDENITDYQTIINNVPANIENCTFRYNVVNFSAPENGGIVENCKFEKASSAFPMSVSVPVQDGNDKFEFTFASCEFAEGTKINPSLQERIYDWNVKGYSYYNKESDRWEWVATMDELPDYAKGSYRIESKFEYVEYDNYNVFIGFDTCEHGGAALTHKSDFIYSNWAPSGVKVRYVIDGTTYVAVYYNGSIRLFEDDEE